MKRLVIAETSDVISTVLRKALERTYEVHICEYGKELPAVLNKLQPEALIINLSLKGTDGITALSNCQYRPPVILSLTYFVSERVLEDAYAVGISELILLPSPVKYLLARFAALSGKQSQLEDER